ncbi:MAG: CRISPR-associated endonuclease Cas3'', partial [Alphaproteobacteria bacterium]
MGKAKPEFQAYLRKECPSAPHSGEGARYAAEKFGGIGKLIAYAIAGHHAGLTNGIGTSSGHPRTPLAQRLADADQLALPDGISLVQPNGLPPHLAGLPADDLANFRLHFFTRMLFSALVDADYLETEAFYDRAAGRQRPRGWNGSLASLRDAVDARLSAFEVPTKGTINWERARILTHARGKAGCAPGL